MDARTSERSGTARFPGSGRMLFRNGRSGLPIGGGGSVQEGTDPSFQGFTLSAQTHSLVQEAAQPVWGGGV